MGVKQPLPTFTSCLRRCCFIMILALMEYLLYQYAQQAPCQCREHQEYMTPVVAQTTFPAKDQAGGEMEGCGLVFIRHKP